MYVGVVCFVFLGIMQSGEENAGASPKKAYQHLNNKVLQKLNQHSD